MTRSTLKRLLLQVAFVLSWSSGYIGAKLGTQGGGAFNLLFWRFLLVAVCLGLFLNVRLLKVSWALVRHYAVIGFLSQFLYLSCLYVAIQNGLPPGIAAIIAALQPLMTAALSTGSATERSGGWQWVGLMISFVGVSIVIAGQYGSGGEGVGLVIYLLPLAAALGLTLATLYERRTVQSQDAGLVLPLFIQSLLTLIGFTVAVLYTDTLSIPRDPDVLISIVWLTVFSTFVAYLSLWMLLRVMTATHVAALVYLEPPVTLVWAALMFGDVIHASTCAGIAVVVAGLLLVRLKRPTVACAS
ncbi:MULTISPECIES: DMT family transporter [Pseudomonas]|uniref:Multidrug DMT transporter permease n=1 Tax=Pseudomonas fluorescens LMG 5329 TaxID=1324332 RepID=A0A0A1YST3_PSEFL|nr:MULTISPECIES: DMT family transporter [Pseudomonas]KGE64893.1 multidrug DMT transporter permease [Pseudomonas fluorescens LMG 5329]NWE02200.1 DMT family transporter [Pseudomonas sp. IPO3749]NWF22057.1 DMT family transporter [Pseudomonas sp. IPO3749]